MFLVARRSVRSSGRGIVLRTWYLSSAGRHNHLAVGFKKKVGRSSSSGQRLVMSKGSSLARAIYRPAASSIFGLFVTSLVVEYQRLSPRRGTAALLCNAYGCWFYFFAVHDMSIFGYYRIIWRASNGLMDSQLFANYRWPAQLTNFPPHSRICLLSSILRSDCRTKAATQYVRAPGSSALLLSTKFYTRWALLLLPSKKFKILNPENIVACFGSTQPQGRISRQPKAGSSRNRGISPRVRGTVKNANDHPNGGRSRALRCSRTPWGQIAKKSRKAR